MDSETVPHQILFSPSQSKDLYIRVVHLLMNSGLYTSTTSDLNADSQHFQNGTEFHRCKVWDIKSITHSQGKKSCYWSSLIRAICPNCMASKDPANKGSSGLQKCPGFLELVTGKILPHSLFTLLLTFFIIPCGWWHVRTYAFPHPFIYLLTLPQSLTLIIFLCFAQGTFELSLFLVRFWIFFLCTKDQEYVILARFNP